MPQAPPPDAGNTLVSLAGRQARRGVIFPRSEPETDRTGTKTRIARPLAQCSPVPTLRKGRKPGCPAAPLSGVRLWPAASALQTSQGTLCVGEDAGAEDRAVPVPGCARSSEPGEGFLLGGCDRARTTCEEPLPRGHPTFQARTPRSAQLK